MTKHLVLSYLVIGAILLIFAAPTSSKNITLPSIDELLKEAGYTKKSEIQIHMTSVFLENMAFHTPMFDVYYYVFSTRSKPPSIEKIKVIVYNHQNTAGINLMMFAPVLWYQKCVREPTRNCGYIQYYPKEIYDEVFGNSDRALYNKFVVKPPVLSNKRIGAYLFDYNSQYRHYYGGFYTENRDGALKVECSFNEIFSRILNAPDDDELYPTNGAAKMCAGSSYDPMSGLKNGGELFFCVKNGFRKLYPAANKIR